MGPPLPSPEGLFVPAPCDSDLLTLMEGSARQRRWAELRSIFVYQTQMDADGQDKWDADGQDK